MAKPTTHRTPTETAAAKRVAALADPDDLTQPMDVPGGPAGNGAPSEPPASDAGALADPTRVGPFEPSVPPAAGLTAAALDASPAGTGRPLLPVDPELGKAMVALAEIAEHGRWGATYRDHVDRVRWLHSWAGRATGKLADREHIPAALWGELAAQVQGWNGGGSA